MSAVDKKILLLRASNELFEEEVRPFGTFQYVPIALFDVVFSTCLKPNIADFSHAFAPSRNAVRALCMRGWPQKKKLIVAGKGSAQLAASLGYQDVLVPDVESFRGVVALLKKKDAYSGEKLLYVHGDYRRFDASAELSDFFQKVYSFRGYRLCLKHAGLRALKRALYDRPWGVVVLSKRIALILKRISLQKDFLTRLSCTRFFGMSKEALAPLTGCRNFLVDDLYKEMCCDSFSI